MEKIRSLYQKNLEKLKGWIKTRYFQLALFNIFLMILVLLRSAGYFDPYFTITINAIVVLAILAAIALLRIRSSFTFFLACLFWVLTGFFRVFSVFPWAERTALYSFQAFIIAMVQFIFEAAL